MRMWKDIEEFKGLYQVSDDGLVRRIKQDGSFHLKSLTERGGAVCVRLSGNNKKCMRSVGNLVARAFIGEPPVGTVAVRHIDGDFRNNCTDNLCWNIPKSHTMPENTEARQLYDKYCYPFMRAWAKKRNLFHFRINGYDIEDIFQEAAMKIWRYIDGYDPERAGFFTFVALNCEAVFNKVYKREINKPQCVSYIDEWQPERYKQPQMIS